MGVHQPVVVVEDHDGGDHGAGHHEHDAVKVGTCHNSLSFIVMRLSSNTYKRNCLQESCQMKERKLDVQTANVSHFNCQLERLVKLS